MTQHPDENGERRADMPTFGSWVLKYLEGAALMRKGGPARNANLLRPALQLWKDRRLDTITRVDCEQMLMGMMVGGDAFATVCLRCATDQEVLARR